MTASVPELPKRTRSSAGTRAVSSSASATSSGVEVAKAVPRLTWRVTASTIGGKPWPWIRAVKLLMASSRSTTSTSVTRHPAPDAT